MFMLKIAWRYVHARLINYVAILVIALTLMASIVVLGVIEGMLVDMERRVSNLGEQIVVYFRAPVPQADLVEDDGGHRRPATDAGTWAATARAMARVPSRPPMS